MIISPFRVTSGFRFVGGCFVYLAGVSCAGLGNITVVDSIAARHPPQLVLSQMTTEEERKYRQTKKGDGK